MAASFVNKLFTIHRYNKSYNKPVVSAARIMTDKGGFLMIFGDKVKKIDTYVKKGKSAKIIPLLMDRKKEVRLTAIKALGSIGNDHCVNNLLLLLGDPDPEIRRQTAASLGDIGKDVCKTHLQSRVKVEEDESVLAAMHDSIMRISAKVGYVK